MSVEATKYAWLKTLPNVGEKIVLLALANWAGEDGQCWGTVRTIAKYTGLTERGVRKVIRRLVARRAVEVRANQGELLPRTKGRAEHQSDLFILVEVRNRVPHLAERRSVEVRNGVPSPIRRNLKDLELDLVPTSEGQNHRRAARAGLSVENGADKNREIKRLAALLHCELIQPLALKDHWPGKGLLSETALIGALELLAPQHTLPFSAETIRAAVQQSIKRWGKRKKHG